METANDSPSSAILRSSASFTEQPKVIDGASDLLVEVFGDEIGRHARTATGVAQLPFGAAVQLELILRVEPVADISGGLEKRNEGGEL